jgi:hypothetical protein
VSELQDREGDLFFGDIKLTNATRTYAPVKVTAEALAEAQRQVGALQRLREQNERMIQQHLAWMMKPMVFVHPPKEPDPIEARMRSYMNVGPTIQGTFYIPPDPVDPLDVKHDGVTLRELLDRDAANRCNDYVTTIRSGPRTGELTRAASAWKLTPAQRAAVSAHWSAELRAKVEASEAADAARRPSVVVEVDDW